MKFMYLANIRIPTEKAHGIQIMNMCRTFAEKGIEIELVVPWRYNPKFKESDLFEYYSIEKVFKVKKLPSLDLIMLNLPKIGFWVQSATFAISVFFYSLFRKVNVIYSRDWPHLFFLSFFKKNLVYEVHYFPRWLFFCRRVFKKAKAIIVVTNGLKRILLKNGVNEKKILIMPDGVDLKRFDINVSKEEARRELNLPFNKKIVLYAGHLYSWKGVQVLTESSKFLNKDILAVFVGGTEKDEKKFKEKNQKFKNIIVLGHRPHSQMPYYLKSADVLILPNSGKKDVSRYWTSPMKMFEYMASQRPIVASDLSSIGEILSENNSILVEPDNPQALAEGIKKVLDDKELSQRISQQAYTDVKKYTWDKRAQKILNFVKNE